MWSVAREACEPALAAAEAGALRQQQRLMARVPGTGIVGRFREAGRHPMTCTAELVDLFRRQARWIARPVLRGIAGMCRARPMAGLAVHAQLIRHDLIFRAERQGTGRVTGETPQDRRRRIKGPVMDTRGIRMSRRDPVAVQR